MAKRKSRGLAGTPEEHRTRAEWHEREAARFAHAAERGKSCRARLHDLDMAASNLAKMHAENSWVPGGNNGTQRQLGLRINKLRHAFEKSCVRGSK